MTSGIYRLAQLIQKQRVSAGLSARELARRAGVDTTTITRLEQAQIPQPRPATLRAVATALDLPPSDLLTSVDYLSAHDLPSFTPYLRSKYGQLSAAARHELEASFQQIAARYGFDPDAPGPIDGEDEQ